MHFREHSTHEGDHAFLSPSSYHWINYTLEKLQSRWYTSRAALVGVEQHRYAEQAIRHGVTQDESTLLGLYINDCIRFRMHPEVILYYSDNCFGTADAIAFRYNKLRISDYKSGLSPTSVHQLEVYAALFCLEYEVNPYSIKMEFRIYQLDEIREYIGDPDVICFIMDKIVDFDIHLNHMRKEDSDAVVD